MIFIWSALNSPAVPLGFRLLLVLLCAAAIARPHWAIAALVGLRPFLWLLTAGAVPRLRALRADPGD